MILMSADKPQPGTRDALTNGTAALVLAKPMSLDAFVEAFTDVLSTERRPSNGQGSSISTHRRDRWIERGDVALLGGLRFGASWSVPANKRLADVWTSVSRYCAPASDVNEPS